MVVLRSSSQPSFLKFTARWTYHFKYIGNSPALGLSESLRLGDVGGRGIFTFTVFHSPFCTMTGSSSPPEFCRLYTTIAMQASRLAKSLEPGNPGIQTTNDFPGKTPREALRRSSMSLSKVLPGYLLVRDVTIVRLRCWTSVLYVCSRTYSVTS